MRELGVAGRIARALIISGSALLLVEGGLRLLEVPDPGLYAGDPGYHWTLRPDVSREVPHLDGSFLVETSGQGLRDDPIPTEGEWVLALGCSTTFGWGVEEEQGWVELLEERLGVPVVNGGIPGHSSEQGSRFAGDLIARGPSAVILAWGVRDHQLAPREDRDAKPSGGLSGSHIIKGLRGLVGQGSAAPEPIEPPPGWVHRVSAERFRENLAQVVSLAKGVGSSVLLLDFPSVEGRPAHSEAMAGVGEALVAPELAAGLFFEGDPIHLTVEGNAALAEALVEPVRGLLSARGGSPAP